MGLSSSRHNIEPVRSKVGDENVAIFCESEPIRKCAREITCGLAFSLLKMTRDFLCNDLLCAVVSHANDTTPRIRRPQRSIFLGKDALRPLQAFTYVPQ